MHFALISPVGADLCKIVFLVNPPWGEGAILLRGFPFSSNSKDSAREAFREWTETLGTLLSQNENGDEVFDVSDAGFAKDDPRTRGPNTKNKLSFHTDRCDVIAFLCWRQALSGGENQLISSQHLYNEIGARRPDLLEVLKQPFIYKRPMGFRLWNVGGEEGLKHEFVKLDGFDVEPAAE